MSRELNAQAPVASLAIRLYSPNQPATFKGLKGKTFTINYKECNLGYPNIIAT